MASQITQEDKASRFAALHVPGRAFVMPNPWDAGSARLLAGLGFEALATTSAGAAFSRAMRDGHVARDAMLAHLADVAGAVDRVRAAVGAVRAAPFPFTLTARAENYLVGHPDLADTIARLQAYQDAGAGVLFAPGLTRLEDIAEVVRSVDRPVSVLAGAPGLTVARLADAGVARISVGSGLARAALGAMLAAATEIRHHGTFERCTAAPRHADINAMF